MSWPEYPYSAVANDESHSLANFTNDPWWKLFRNWKHLSNRGRVLSHTRYNDIEIAHDAAGTSTTETLRVSVACTPLDRIFVCLPYFVVADVGRHWAGAIDLRIAHNATTEHLDGSHTATSEIDQFALSLDVIQGDRVGAFDRGESVLGGPQSFGPGGPLALGWPLAVGGAGWSPGQAEGFLGDPHYHVSNSSARGGDHAAYGSLTFAYRCSFSGGAVDWDDPLMLRLRGLTVLGFRAGDL